MALNVGNVTVNVKCIPEIKISLWDAIKIRISGIYKNIDTITTVGKITKIKYK